MKTISIDSFNRGFRNGIVTGVRVRLPYIFQAAVYAVLFKEGKYVII